MITNNQDELRKAAQDLIEVIQHTPLGLSALTSMERLRKALKAPVQHEPSELPDLPWWTKLDNLGGLVPSAVREEMQKYARTALATREAKAEAAPVGKVLSNANGCWGALAGDLPADTKLYTAPPPALVSNPTAGASIGDEAYLTMLDEYVDTIFHAPFKHERRMELRKALLDARRAPAVEMAAPYQQRVQPWMLQCFGEMIAGDREERNHRFLEESLELVQACGCTKGEAYQLVDYVFGRPVGEKEQEVGGVMVTLAALCLAQGMDMDACGETELSRIWTKVEAIRAKQAAKPKHSPLPVGMVAAPMKYSVVYQGEEEMIPLEIIGVYGDSISTVITTAAPDLSVREAAERVLSFREGELPTRGWLRDNDASRAALQELAQVLRPAASKAKEE